MSPADIKFAFIMNKITSLTMEYAPKLLLAVITLIVGSFLIKKAVKIFNFALNKKGLDESLQGFLSSLLGWTLKALLLISVASMVGIATTSFVALLGAAGLAVGMALQGSLSNFAGGVLILLFKPFKTGDYIVAQGEEGFVSRIDVFCTVLTKLDNQRVILPNGPLAGGKVTNVGAESTRRVDLSVGVDYGTNLKEAFKTLINMCHAHNKVLKDPATFVGVTNYGDSSVNLTIRTWCNTEDYWDVFFDLNEQIKNTLEDAKIKIPYPVRVVHQKSI